MNVRSRVEETLSAPQNFLMFKGGTGGEFLTSQIYKYSSKFSSNIHDVTKHIDINRTTLVYPKFYLDLFSNCPQNFAKGNIAEFMSDYLKKYDDETLHDMFDEVDFYLNNHTHNLFRLHTIINGYFSGKTNYILLDEPKWFEYASILNSLKNMLNVNYLRTFYNSFSSRQIVNVFNIDEWICKLESKNITKIPLIKMLCLMNNIGDLRNKQDELISASVTDLYKQHSITIYKPHANHILQGQTICHNKFGYDLIHYSKYFEKGYLEDIFEINSNEFHYNLLEWHEKNLELMSANNFDISEYKL